MLLELLSIIIIRINIFPYYFNENPRKVTFKPVAVISLCQQGVFEILATVFPSAAAAVWNAKLRQFLEGSGSCAVSMRTCSVSSVEFVWYWVCRWGTGVPVPPPDSYHRANRTPWSLLLPVVVLASVPRLCDCWQLCHPQKDTRCH